jgi:hypothetical protein
MYSNEHMYGVDCLQYHVIFIGAAALSNVVGPSTLGKINFHSSGDM